MPQQVSLFENSKDGQIGGFFKGGGLVARLGGKIQLSHSYDDIISLENLCLAWSEFIVGKKKKVDVVEFDRQLMDNIVELHDALVNPAPRGMQGRPGYNHGGYESFYINDPKRRHIHKASVRDRLLHHAIYRILYPFFDKTFIADSYSCRNEKGTHKAIGQFRQMAFRVSRNHTRTCWVLKCDIRKFFASIDHEILFTILREYIPDQDIIWLLRIIISSFHSGETLGIGLPLGNLTSQLLANVYMNRFDQWVKHSLKAKNYIRYADDFVFLSDSKAWLTSIILPINEFLESNLKLTLHPNKLFLKTMASGVDFLGWVNFPDHRILRNQTRRRMFQKIKQSPTDSTFQ